MRSSAPAGVASVQLETVRRVLSSWRTVEIPDLGTMTIAEWTPLILGHLTGHVEQAVEILRDRDALPAGG